MEESEKRKERLRAMRREADQAGAQGDAADSMGASHSLANPLIEASVTPRVDSEQRAAPRFDYYTDPMSAFSADKRRSKVSHQISPDYLTPPRPMSADMTPSPQALPAYQAQATYSLDQRVFQSSRPYHRSGPFGSPMGIPPPFGTPQGSINVGGRPTGMPAYVPSNLPRGGNVASPGFAPVGSPSFNYGQGRGRGFSNSPLTGSGNFGSPYPNRGRGRSQWHGNNSPQTPGRGSGRGQGRNGPVSMRSGKGVDSRDSESAEHNPSQFYHKSMVEDPWEMLKPVIWRRKDASTSLDAPDSIKSWVPESISAKKPKVSEASHKYNSGRSFAEDLAASFHAATNYEPTDDSAEQNL